MKLRAEELRINNRVLDHEGYIDIVNGVYFNNNRIILHEYGLIDLSNISPIPLTEEILLKCGARLMENKKGFYVGRVLALNKNRDYWYDMDLDLELKSLHQLQNLYFALTGEELTVKL